MCNAASTIDVGCAWQGFLWDINSWDQWGVELGKTLATEVRGLMQIGRQEGAKRLTSLNPSTSFLLQVFIEPQATKIK